MKVISILWGIVSILGMVIGIPPFLSFFNLLVIPFAGIGLIASVIVLTTTRQNKNIIIIAVICCIIAIVGSMTRLFLFYPTY
ncbi:MAG TPA: hypothetical protein VJC37_03990 [Planctomycetota bacterium]|nr:hypothetical protein [Planctomycetota bacterium]